MPDSPLVLRSSAHAEPRWRNSGGGRRSEQLEEILQRHGISWTDKLDAPAPSRLAVYRAAWNLRRGKPAVRYRWDRRLMEYLGRDYLRHRWFFERNPGMVFLVEEAVDYARLRAARDCGIRIVCCPHNFETWQFSPAVDFYSGEGLPVSVHREAMFAGLAERVFCISREEQWFLANHGIEADFLPYHPPSRQLADLARVREDRASATVEHGLVLAVANGTNSRNLEGLRSLARVMKQMPANSGFHLHVGGFETESLRAEFSIPGCTFHGKIADDELAALMRRCSAAVIHQESGTGALTRIPELLCAGIPVLASPHAARSARHLPGVHVYHDAAELGALARTRLPTPPAPAADAAAEARLVRCIRGQSAA